MKKVYVRDPKILGPEKSRISTYSIIHIRFSSYNFLLGVLDQNSESDRAKSKSFKHTFPITESDKTSLSSQNQGPNHVTVSISQERVPHAFDIVFSLKKKKKKWSTKYQWSTYYSLIGLQLKVLGEIPIITFKRKLIVLGSTKKMDFLSKDFFQIEYLV